MSAVDLVAEAAQEKRGIGAFNVVLIEHAEAIAEAAERAGSAVIFQISQNCVAYHRALEPIALATMSIARSMHVPALVHLDHADDVALVHQAIRLGLHSVMFDASRMPYAGNVRLTREVAARCHAEGVLVEAELGEIGGKDGVHRAGARTDPAEAASFVAQTGVDWLAVAVGTSHAMDRRDGAIDTGLISELSSRVDAPLVLHGSSGLPDEQLQAAVYAGMTKVNISTHLNRVFTRAVQREIELRPENADPRRYVGPGRAAFASEVTRLLLLLEGSPITPAS